MFQVTILSHLVKLCLRLWGILKEHMPWFLKASIIQMSWLLASVAVRYSLVSKYATFGIAQQFWLNIKFLIICACNSFSSTLLAWYLALLDTLLSCQEFNENASNGSAFQDDNFLSKSGHAKELFLSSDANAVVEHTKKVLVIEDGEVVHLKVLT